MDTTTSHCEKNSNSCQHNGQDPHYQAALKHVEKLKNFYKHLASYVIFNILFLIINILSTPKQLWFYWITIFWGVGIATQAASLFWQSPKFGKKWEERKVQEYLNQKPK